MKKLPITKEAFEKSKYFQNKYGKLEYVSESGKLFKTDKGKIMKFKESISSEEDPDLDEDSIGMMEDITNVVFKALKEVYGDSVQWNNNTYNSSIVVNSNGESIRVLFDDNKDKIMKFKESVGDEPSSNGDYARRLGDAMSVVKEIGESGLLSSAWDRQIQKLYDNLEGLKKLVERKQ